MYMPTLARFTARDPLSPEGPILLGRIPDTLTGAVPYAAHPYGYSSNNPMTYSDPSGEVIHVYAFEGAGAAVGFSPKQVEKYFKPVADKYGNRVKWNYSFQKKTDPFGLGKILNGLVEIAINTEPGCNCCYPRIVLLGFSWGGQSVWQAMEFLSKQQPRLKVDAVLTIDPVFGAPATSETQSGAEKFDNFCKWKSFFQTTDTNTLLGKPVRGDQISGADNTELRDLGANGAHLKIAEDRRVIAAFDEILADYALLLPDGPRRKDWKGKCPIPTCYFCDECC